MFKIQIHFSTFPVINKLTIGHFVLVWMNEFLRRSLFLKCLYNHLYVLLIVLYVLYSRRNAQFGRRSYNCHRCGLTGRYGSDQLWRWLVRLVVVVQKMESLHNAGESAWLAWYTVPFGVCLVCSSIRSEYEAFIFLSSKLQNKISSCQKSEIT